jgi:hypothetical protein
MGMNCRRISSDFGMRNVEYGMQITVGPVTVMTQRLLHGWANDDQVVTGVAAEEALRGIDYEE